MNDDSTVNIEIDGVALQAPKGTMIVEVADRAGIHIPRFCYHKKLSIAASCRMCLVEVEKSPKPLPACATPVMDGMKVFTRSPKAIEAQQGTMEFLLINHPLDCPVCDQGGECELQDVAMGYGGDVSRYTEGKRVLPDQDLGPLIATDMTRCIHCTRCVRFGIEIAGIQELGAPGRGENTRIGVYMESAVGSEMSGNAIDLCPVGALTAKPSHMTARAWELRRHAAVAPHDCVGSNLFVHTRRNEVNRVVPRDNEAINECWLADRDRFSYQGLKSEARLRVPMIKRGDVWQECAWDTALEAAVKGLQGLLGEHGGEQLGLLVSPNATLEEMALLQRLAQGIGCGNLDHRLRQSDFSDQDAAPPFPWLGRSIEELERLDAALLIGSDVRREQPMIAHRLRKAAGRGARLMFINYRDFDFHFRSEEKILCGPGGMVGALAGVAKALFESAGAAVPETARRLLESVEVSEAQAAMAERLSSSSNACILLGVQALAHPALASLRTLAGMIAEAAGVTLGYLPDGANAAGAWLAGVLPDRGPGGADRDRRGLDARTMLESPRKAYLLHAVEPEYDCQDPQTALAALTAAEFVVALTPFVSEAMRGYADVLLPIASFTETSGTYVNVEGRWQGFAGAAAPPGEARPAWKVLRVMGNLLDLGGFGYLSSAEVRDELRGAIGELRGDNRTSASVTLALPGPEAGAVRVSGVPMYAVDGVTRRAAPLQQTADGRDAVVLRIGRRLARELGLEEAQRVLVTQGGAQTSMAMVIDQGVADGCVWLPAGTETAARLGPMFGPIQLEAD